jgi:hypothetical protein
MTSIFVSSMAVQVIMASSMQYIWGFINVL